MDEIRRQATAGLHCLTIASVQSSEDRGGGAESTVHTETPLEC